MKDEDEFLYWQRVDGTGAPMERARVEGGWLYRGVRHSPCDHVTALAFVPDVKEQGK